MSNSAIALGVYKMDIETNNIYFGTKALPKFIKEYLLIFVTDPIHAPLQ